MYTIKRVAELTGLPPTTLRAWERRYGVVAPIRSEGGYRLYDDAAVRVLTTMSALVLQGWSPSQAAEEATRRIASGADSEAVTVHAQPADELATAAARLDQSGVTRALDERFSVSSFETVIDDWLMPSMDSLGSAWADGRVSVAGEHLAAYAVMRRLSAAYDAASAGATGPRIVVGLPPGARHELGILAFAVAARRAGLRAAYLGADLPVADWISAAAEHQPRAAVLSATQESELPALSAVVDGLRASQPALLIAVGGKQQAQAPDGCLRLGHDIGAGAALLASTLA